MMYACSQAVSPQDMLLNNEPFLTEKGELIPYLRLRYETYGTLNEAKDNAVMVFHGLGRGAHLAGIYDDNTLASLSVLEQNLGAEGWWNELVGPGKPLDTDRFFIVSPNTLGGCHGSTGPMSLNPATGRPYGPEFPELTLRDIGRAHARLAQHLGIKRLKVIGPSFGGTLALEFAVMFPEMTTGFLCIAAPAQHTAWSKSLLPIAGDIIRRDPEFLDGWYQRQPLGLTYAWAMMLPTLRTPESFKARWKDRLPETSLIMHMAQGWAKGFDANAFLVLLKAVEGHDIGRGRGPVTRVLGDLDMHKMFIAVDSDLLFASEEIRQLAWSVDAEYAEITSIHGHVASIIEMEQMAPILRDFMAKF